MLGFSYGEIFLLLGATAALIGPKDLPIIARTAGRFAGRAIGYVQLARGQFESVMQQSQARQVHKELQDTIAQLEAIRHEIRAVSFMNPGPLTSRLVDNISATAGAGTIANGPQKSDEESTIVENGPKKSDKESKTVTVTPKDHNSGSSALTDMHSQAAAYARLAEMTPLKSLSVDREGLSELTDESGSIIVLPVSAESAGLLPKRKDEAKGSDIVLEAILEAEVANNAKEFFSQPQNQLKSE
ncbi:uncharacterized protein LOC107787420 [Nicotiana tabacum]|uniref:Uncharacterized protein LOC107787420 n=6 Tax=Nicotiana tabacum TaxID=4097 RepID=A0AC58SB58_TOBAC|nr:PREDICTED: sec-independent protein translocase protein TatB-like [Nicotiana tabacum]XP_018629179.1 sec-independent protein translocase protein TatB [Nicotiana tomentosiformis]XP_033514227.1 sec-independent protein translocase protein TatB [Nicotiana tomentosiformis]XP_033514228.1 sec-independent protein translocase protein TatB [Nicotiana tomentosiformis]